MITSAISIRTPKLKTIAPVGCPGTWVKYHSRVVSGRPFVKQFAPCYRTVFLSCRVCNACLSVTLVYGGQTVGWIKIKLSMQVGLGLIVLDRDTALIFPKRGHSPQFSAHVCCGQMAAWIKMPVGTNVSLGPGDFVLEGDPAPSP